MDFVLYYRNEITTKEILPLGIYACDESTIWLDATSSSTVSESGSREVSVRSTGHEKVRLAVLLCAQADGLKLKPYILLPRRRSMPDLVKQYSLMSLFVTLLVQGRGEACDDLYLDAPLVNIRE